MARASKRDDVLEAVVTIIERDGLTAVTLDAVAAEIGMTRAGLLYHFPSREALIRATHEHLAGQWERELVASAGGEGRRFLPTLEECRGGSTRIGKKRSVGGSEAGTSSPGAQSVGPTLQGANSSSPTPWISLFVRLPLATARISSKIASPTADTAVPSRMTPASMSMSSSMRS